MNKGEINSNGSSRMQALEQPSVYDTLYTLNRENERERGEKEENLKIQWK